MLTFLTGLDTAGKRKHISETISDLIDREQKVYLIVPEQSSFDRDREFLFAYGEKKSNKLRVTSFTHFSEDILEECGRAVKPRSDDNARTVLMSLAVRENADSLEIFKKYAGRAECIARLLGMYDEIKQAGLSCADLAEVENKVSGNLRRKTGELSKIFASFEGLLTSRFSDPSDNLRNAAEALGGKGMFTDAVFFFDGFRGFTGAQIAFLVLIASECRDCFVSVTAPSLVRDEHTEAFAHSLRNAENIRRAAAAHGLRMFERNTDGKDAEQKAASVLRRLLFGTTPERFDGETDYVTLINAPDVYEECELAALAIKRLLLSGMRCRDIAVFERGSLYAGKLIPVLKKYGIPVFEDKRRPFFAYPLVRLILAAVDAAANGFDTEKVLACVKTGLCGADPDECPELEKYVYCWNISRSGWEKDFTDNPDGFGAAYTDEVKERLDTLNAARAKVIEPLVRLRERLRKEDDADPCGAVYMYLKETHAADAFLCYARSLNDGGDEAGAAECGRVWDECMEHLDSLHGALNGRRVSPGEFFSLLQLMLCSGSLGDIPAGIDEIIIGSADRMRFLSPAAVVVLGANEGVFPRPASAEGIFSPREERALALNGFALESLPENKYAEERLIVFDALTCAERSLTVCWSDASVTGDKLAPSEIVRELRRIFPGAARLGYDDFDKGERLCTPRAAFEEYAGIAGENTLFAASLRQAVRRRGTYAGSVDALERAAAGTPAAFEDPRNAAELFGTELRSSASQTEAYHKCPFLYFCRYGMRVSGPVSSGLDSRVNGLLVHSVLEKIFGTCSNREICDMSEEQMRTVVSGFVRGYVDEYMGGEASLPPAVRRDVTRSEAELNSMMKRFVSEFSSCSFSTCRVELKIGGRDEDIPAYTLRLPDGGSITVTGSIDRVDTLRLDGKNYVRVIDYKTGGKDFSLSDVFEGLNMQMLIYLFALCRNGKELYGDLLPAGILYVPANAGGDSVKDRHADAETIRKQKLSNGRMNGLLLENEDVLRGMEREAQGVYLNASVKTSGELSGAFLSLGEFSVLNDLIDHVLVTTGADIHAGRIPALPAESAVRTCEYCDYAAVCLREDSGPVRKSLSLRFAQARDRLKEFGEESDRKKAAEEDKNG